MFQNLLYVALGVLVGGVAALKIIAPKTSNKTDDAVLAKLEALEKLVEGLLGK